MGDLLEKLNFGKRSFPKELDELTPRGVVLLKADEEMQEKVALLKETVNEMKGQNSDHRVWLTDSISEVLEKLETSESKGKKNYNTLQEVRSILAHLEGNIDRLSSSLKERDRVIETLNEEKKKLREGFIFENRIKPGALKLIQTRGKVLSRLDHLQQDGGSEEESFLRALDKQLTEGLKKFGIEEIEPPDSRSPFQPDYQEAVETSKVRDRNLEGKVLDWVSPGYRIDGRLFRPQKVIVGKFTGGEHTDES